MIIDEPVRRVKDVNKDGGRFSKMIRFVQNCSNSADKRRRHIVAYKTKCKQQDNIILW